MSSAIFELFGTLTKGARAALPFLRAAAETEKTVSEILEEASTLGFKFRHQAGLDIIGVLRNNISAARAIRVAAPDVPLNPITYGQSIGKLKRAFSYVVKISVKDRATGDRRATHVTVSSNDILSRNEVLAKAHGFGLELYTENEESIEEVSVVDALRDSSIGGEVGPYDPLGLLRPSIQP